MSKIMCILLILLAFFFPFQKGKTIMAFASLCGHCGLEAPEFQCSRCGAARFCYPKCFRKAWQKHKLHCKTLVSTMPGRVEDNKNQSGVVVVVPFREQLPLQHRGEQLARFLPHMRRFLSGLEIPHRVLVVEQSQDGRKFNRGQLLNVGF